MRHGGLARSTEASINNSTQFCFRALIGAAPEETRYPIVTIFITVKSQPGVRQIMVLIFY